MLARSAGRGIGIAGAQMRPPSAFQSFLEGLGVERAQDVAAHACGVFCHEGQSWLEQPIGSREKVAEQSGVAKERGCVLAVVAGEQADPVQGAEIAGTVGTDERLCTIRGAHLPACAWLQSDPLAIIR